MTFWWRRCSEQSRSNRWTTLPCAVAEHLHLDVARAGDVLLQQHAVVAEAGAGLALARGQRRGEILGLVDLAHALAAAAGHGLDQHGKPILAASAARRSTDWSSPR